MVNFLVNPFNYHKLFLFYFKLYFKKEIVVNITIHQLEKLEAFLMLMDNIKKLRTEKKLSMRALSEKSGVSKTTISEIENGIVTNPTLVTIEKIAKALDALNDDILGVDLAELVKTAGMKRQTIQINIEKDTVLDTSNTLHTIKLNKLEKVFLEFILSYLDDNDFTLSEMKEILHFIEFIVDKKKEGNILDGLENLENATFQQNG